MYKRLPDMAASPLFVVVVAGQGRWGAALRGLGSERKWVRGVGAERRRREGGQATQESQGGGRGAEHRLTKGQLLLQRPREQPKCREGGGGGPGERKKETGEGARSEDERKGRRRAEGG